MKSLLLLALLLSSSIIHAEDVKKEEWKNTTLSDETVKNIQQTKYEYSKCATTEMQKADYAKIDIRNATDGIIKNCEKILANIRKVYLDAEVPGVIADRHLKQMRIQTTRNVLNTLMLKDAARKSSQIDAAKTAQ